jgi:hypothetical protein
VTTTIAATAGITMMATIAAGSGITGAAGKWITVGVGSMLPHMLRAHSYAAITLQ